MKLVSIIIPAYNVENYIERCLVSVLEQTYNQLEIIIVDDGSSDGTYKKCENFANADSRIQLYSQKNAGVSSARNYGLNKAQGDYICFVDADDYVSSIYVEVMLQDIKSTNSEISITMCQRNTEPVDKNTNTSVEVWNYKETLLNLLTRDIYANGVVGKLFKKQVIEDLYFDTCLRIGEDKLFVYSAIDKCNKVVFHDINLYCYCIRSGSAMKSKFDERYLDVQMVNNTLYKTWINRYPELERLFKKEVVISYVRCVQDSLQDDSKEALKLRKKFLNEIKKCKFSDIKEYCSKKEKCLIILIKNALWIFKIYEKKKSIK